eukprot:m.190554 g.190554  ORF g.190554 m.190554 type:complete len:244 (+) comp14822_c0_seq1:323-1054(+)
MQRKCPATRLVHGKTSCCERDTVVAHHHNTHGCVALSQSTMKFLVLAAVLAVATATRVPTTLTVNPITRFRPFAMALDVGTQPNDNNVALEPSDSGWSFSAATAATDVPVCMNLCEDGRDCFVFSEGCTPDCDYCIEVAECEDIQSKRCTAIVDCPCANGKLVCEPSNFGVQFNTMADAGDYTDRFDLLLNSGFYAVVAQEQCANGGSFDFIPCEVNGDMNCLSVEPCVSDDMSCCMLTAFNP